MKELELVITILHRMDFNKVKISIIIDLVQYFFSPALGNLKKFKYETSIPFESMSKLVYSRLAADFMQPETQSL
jgi:hypothetical protein